jgi:O-antigen/teichoic acid export membrane protein
LLFNIKNSLFRSVSYLLGINGISFLALFLISVVIFRTVDKSDYGLYVIILSLFALVDLLMAGLNETIIRFLKDKISISDKQSILVFILFYKYFLILIFILGVYLAKYVGFFQFLIGNYDEVSGVVDSFLLVAIFNGILSTLIGINNYIFNSQMRYKLTANVGFARNIAYLVIVIVLSFYTKEYLYYLYSSVALSACVMIYLSIKIINEHNEFSVINLLKAKLNLNIAKKYIFPYATPLTASSILTYVKNHLPTIILGKEFSLENVAVFSILKTLFKALHSLTSSFIDPMMSKFLELKEQSIDFSKSMNYIFWFTLLLRGFLFAILFFLIHQVFVIYKIEDTHINQLVFYFLGLEFIVAGTILVYGIILRLDKQTTKVFIASFVRFLIELSLIFFILFDYGIIAAALILLIARYIETLVTFMFVRRERIFRYTGFILTSFLFILSYCAIQLKVIFV